MKKRSNTDGGKGYTVLESICGFFDNRFFSLCKNSLFGRFFGSCDRFEKSVKESFFVRNLGDLKKKHYKNKYHPKRELGTEQIDPNLKIYNRRTLRVPVSERFRIAAADNRIVSVTDRLRNSVQTAPASVLGVFVFSLSILSVIIQMLCFLLGNDGSGRIFEMCVGFLLLVVSVPIMTKNDVTLFDYVTGSRFGGKILTMLFGLEDKHYFASGHAHKHASHLNFPAFVLGVLLGILTLRFSVITVLLVAAVVFFLVAVVRVPEAGLLVYFFFLPFFGILPNGEKAGTAFLFFVTVTFLARAVLGNRTVRFDVIDYLFAVCAAFFALGELITPYKGASAFSAVFSCWAVYFLSVNMLSVGGWLDKLLACISASSIIVSAIGICQVIVTGKTGVSSVFNSPDLLFVYLSIAVFASFALARSRNLPAWLLFASVSFPVVCMLFSGTGCLIAAFLLTCLTASAVCRKKVVSVMLLFLLCLPFALPFVSPDISDKLLTALSFNNEYFSAIGDAWKKAFEIAGLNPLGGIGLSEVNSGMAYAAVSGAGDIPTGGSHSIFLGVLMSSGIVGILVFVSLLLVYTRKGFTFYGRTRGLSNEIEVFCPCFSAFFAAVLCGCFVWFFESPACTGLFFGFIGISLALMRKTENHEIQYKDELTPTYGEMLL